jgi:hypothetical protein
LQYTGAMKASSEIEEMIWLTTADRNKISAVDQLILITAKTWIKIRFQKQIIPYPLLQTIKF